MGDWQPGPSPVPAGAVVEGGASHGETLAAQAPWMLREPSVHFADRAREIEVMDEALAAHEGADRRGPLLVVLAGVGGVGKTATALRWLHTLRERFPDGALYARLGGPGVSAAVSPAAVLGVFLRALRVDTEQLSGELDELAVVFADQTARRQMVILLDDAATAAQVRSLLPTGRHVVVVTTRRQLSALSADHAVLPLRLDPLAAADGATLLASILGQTRVAAQQAEAEVLAGRCGGLPLALCVAGARLVRRPRWPLARLVAELEDKQGRLLALEAGDGFSVRSVFDVMYEELSPELARVYRLLGTHPGPDFTAGVAAAITSLPLVKAEAVLDALVDANLLEESGEDRYRLHDLLREHAEAQARREESAAGLLAATGRVVDYYLTLAVQADLTAIPLRWRVGERYRHAQPGRNAFATRAQAMAWLEAERLNLRAAVFAAAEAELDEVAWQLCEALWALYYDHKHYTDWLETHQEVGVSAAARSGVPGAEGRIRNQLGYALLELGHVDEALTQFQAALEVDERAGFIPGQASAYESMGLAHLARSRGAEALGSLRRSQVLAETLNRPRRDALLQMHIGRALHLVGEHDAAVVSLRAGRQSLAALGDRYSAGRAAMYLAAPYWALGQRETARQVVLDARATMRELDAIGAEADAARQLADLTDDVQASRGYLEEALTLYRRIGSRTAEEVERQLNPGAPA